jgi:uncharacterized membrane protein
MQSHARLFGHPAHQMLVAFPLGLLITGCVFDLIALATGYRDAATAGYWAISAGILGAIAAAPFGAIDWWHIPKRTRACRIGAYHGIGNLLVVALFIAAWFLRGNPADPAPASLALSFAGCAVLFLTAWLGGELVSRLGIGVYENADVDAPSSLRSPGGAPDAAPKTPERSARREH